MKHFIGGWAVGFVVVFFWSMERARQNAADSTIFGLVFGLAFGLAAWGLLP